MFKDESLEMLAGSVSQLTCMFLLAEIVFLAKTTVFTKQYSHTLSLRLLFNLAVSDLLGEFSLFIHSCTFQALGIQLFALSSLAWTVSIFALYNTSAKSSILYQLEPILHLLCWGTPLFLTGLMVTENAYGSTTNLYCWIPPKEHTMRLLLLYIPLFIAFLYLMRVYSSLVLRYPASKTLHSSLSQFLLLFTLLRLPGLVHRYLEYSSDHSIPKYLLLAHSLALPLQPIANIYMFLTNPLIVRYVSLYSAKKLAVSSSKPLDKSRTLVNNSKAQSVNLDKSKEISVFTTTINLSMETVPDLSAWIPQGYHDLVVIGLQECYGEDWIQRITRETELQIITAITFGPTKLLVLATQQLAEHISNVRSTSLPLSSRLFSSNHGAVGCSLTLWNSKKLLFLNAHLQPDQELTPLQESLSYLLTRIPLSLQEKSLSEVYTYLQYDSVFVLGDLGFPLLDLNELEIQRLNRDRNWAILEQKDSLTRCRAEEDFLYDLQEGKLMFGCGKRGWSSRVLWWNRDDRIHLMQTWYNMGSIDVHQAVGSSFRLSSMMSALTEDFSLSFPQKLTVSFKELRLSGSKCSDDKSIQHPYLKVYGSQIVSSSLKTFQTVVGSGPDELGDYLWSQESCPVLVCRPNSDSDFNIFISIRESTLLPLEEDVIGQSCITIKYDAILQGMDKFQFKVPLIYQTFKNGVISGNLVVSFTET